MLKKRLFELALVFLFLLLASTGLWFTDADRLIIATLVPRDLSIAAVLPSSSWAWPAGNLFPWSQLYRWAAVPAVLIATAALLVLLAGFVAGRWTDWRRPALFILLFIAIGPGLTVNILLKEQIGRARPREIVEFGGRHQFTQFWQTGDAGGNSSFPSGHAAIAFFTIAPWFTLRGRHKKTAAAFLGMGLIFGVLVGIARILQGGHFASDILWAGGLLYLIGGGLALVMGLEEETKFLHPRQTQPGGAES
ncbi:MAG: phosphatase PAP2 family protein [Candidatus Electronema sp. V4]|uniref:phosphatase PAP2 family protein n=1 Tax=Candidatus Electronema sp. V4 TaxID=3454756 RepID=UPI00405570FE